MNKEPETTISVSLNQMYELGLDHAIDTVKESMFDIKKLGLAGSMVNPVLEAIIEKLQNLKAKG